MKSKEVLQEGWFRDVLTTTPGVRAVTSMFPTQMGAQAAMSRFTSSQYKTFQTYWASTIQNFLIQSVPTIRANLQAETNTSSLTPGSTTISTSAGTAQPGSTTSLNPQVATAATKLQQTLALNRASRSSTSTPTKGPTSTSTPVTESIFKFRRKIKNDFNLLSFEEFNALLESIMTNKSVADILEQEQVNGAQRPQEIQITQKILKRFIEDQVRKKRITAEQRQALNVLTTNFANKYSIQSPKKFPKQELADLIGWIYIVSRGAESSAGKRGYENFGYSSQSYTTPTYSEWEQIKSVNNQAREDKLPLILNYDNTGRNFVVSFNSAGKGFWIEKMSDGSTKIMRSRNDIQKLNAEYRDKYDIPDEDEDTL